MPCCFHFCTVRQVIIAYYCQSAVVVHKRLWLRLCFMDWLPWSLESMVNADSEWCRGSRLPDPYAICNQQTRWVRQRCPQKPIYGELVGLIWNYNTSHTHTESEIAASVTCDASQVSWLQLEMIDGRIWCVRNIVHDQNDELPRERHLSKTGAALCFCYIPRPYDIILRCSYRHCCRSSANIDHGGISAWLIQLAASSCIGNYSKCAECSSSTHSDQDFCTVSMMM